MSHEPVLCEESVAILRDAGPGLYVDATLGAGGHAAALLAAMPDARVLGIDRDRDALALARQRLAGFGERVFFCRATSLNCRSCSRLIGAKACAGCSWILD